MSFTLILMTFFSVFVLSLSFFHVFYALVFQVHGFVQDNRTGEKVAMLVGKWDEAMYYVLGDPTTKPKGYDPMTEAVLLWERDKYVTKTRYNLSPFAISLNELTPGLLEKLPPTDSRLRPDQRHLENGEYELANAQKLRLEQLQRQVFLYRSLLCTRIFLTNF